MSFLNKVIPFLILLPFAQGSWYEGAQKCYSSTDCPSETACFISPFAFQSDLLSSSGRDHQGECLKVCSVTKAFCPVNTMCQYSWGVCIESKSTTEIKTKELAWLNNLLESVLQARSEIRLFTRQIRSDKYVPVSINPTNPTTRPRPSLSTNPGGLFKGLNFEEMLQTSVNAVQAFSNSNSTAFFQALSPFGLLTMTSIFLNLATDRNSSNYCFEVKCTSAGVTTVTTQGPYLGDAVLSLPVAITEQQAVSALLSAGYTNTWISVVLRSPVGFPPLPPVYIFTFLSGYIAVDTTNVTNVFQMS